MPRRKVRAQPQAKYDAAVCEGLKAEMDAGANLVFNFDAFRKPSETRCDADSDCGANQVCQFVDQGEVSGSFCFTPCSAGALFDQLREELQNFKIFLQNAVDVGFLNFENDVFTGVIHLHDLLGRGKLGLR